MAKAFRYIILAIFFVMLIAASCDAGFFGKKFGLMKAKFIGKPMLGFGFMKPKFYGKKGLFKKKKFFG